MSGLQTKRGVEEKALMVLLIEAPEDESGTLTKVRASFFCLNPPRQRQARPFATATAAAAERL
ncbi:hypothetical protein CMV_005177, partial [Castanea mollissima]